MKRFAPILLLACSHIAAPTPTPKPTPVPSDVTDLSASLEPIRAKGSVPVLGAAAWRGDKLIAIGATGTRKAGGDERVTIDDQWHLDSDTKAMTALLVAIYVDRGKLHFEDRLQAQPG
jgi:CubicO group peptidase (beta-lactamase class C family)